MTELKERREAVAIVAEPAEELSDVDQEMIPYGDEPCAFDYAQAMVRPAADAGAAYDGGDLGAV